MFKRERSSARLNIFSGSPPKAFSAGLSPVPVCFGVIRELMQHPLGGCVVLKREIGCTSRGECCSPTFPSGKVPSFDMEILFPPSCGFPPKSFPLKRGPTISGETFGTRARGRPRTAPPRRRHVMPLAMRPLREESGALLAHFTSALGTHTVAAALKRASPCERLVSGSTPN